MAKLYLGSNIVVPAMYASRGMYATITINGKAGDIITFNGQTVTLPSSQPTYTTNIYIEGEYLLTYVRDGVTKTITVTINDSRDQTVYLGYYDDNLLARYDAIYNQGEDQSHSSSATTWVDLTGNGNTLTITNPSTTVWNENNLESSTMTCYANSEDSTLSTNTTYVEVVIQRTSVSNTYAFLFSLNSSKFCDIKGTSVGMNIANSYSTFPKVATVNTFTVGYDFTNNQRYGDGQLLPNDTTTESWSNQDTVFTLGARSRTNSNNGLIGKIYAVRLYSSVPPTSAIIANASIDRQTYNFET